MPLKVYKRGNYWHYRGTVAGRELRGSTKATDKAIAEQIANQKEADAWKGVVHGPASVLTFAQAAIYYLDAGKPRRFIAKVAAYWKDTPVSQITPGAIKDSARILFPTAKPATRNRQVIVPTQAIINFNADAERCAPIRVKRFPVTKRERKHVTEDWLDAFMDHAGTPHLAALACFMFSTGARISEALAVTWDDVNMQAATVRIDSTKIGEERTAHMPQPLVVALANIEGERTGRVFKIKSRGNARTQWNGTIRRAGIEYMSYHCCRHGFATAALQAGLDVITVAKRGGWKSPAHVFATYGHAIEDITVTERIFRTKSRQKRRK